MIVSTELGIAGNISATKFWGGDKGVSLQLTATDGQYVQMTAGEIVALMPCFKKILNDELNRQKTFCEDVLERNKELKKSIVSDMHAVAEMAISQPVFDMASLLTLGGVKLEVTECE